MPDLRQTPGEPLVRAGPRRQCRVMLILQALPLIALVALLAAGRGPVMACAAARLLTLPAAAILGGGVAGLPGFVVRAAAEGTWLALVPVGIISGGLVFHAAVTALRQSANGQTVTSQSRAAQLFTAAFLLGPFAEAVTGFGVGTVFAMGAVRAAGVSGAAAAAIALGAQVLIPWGGLGPGTAIGAALAGVDPQAMTARNAMLLAPSLLLLLPLFWWWCARAGVVAGWGERLRQALWVLGIGVLLVASHHVFPWQVCGALSVGVLLSARLLMVDPLRDRGSVRRAIGAAAPYALLVGLLLGLRLWPNAPALHPFDGLPSPAINHAMTALWLSALLLVVRLVARLGHGIDHGIGHGIGLVRAALLRARRPALALLMFVVLARSLANTGVPVALAQALVASFGSAAPFAAPLLAAAAGFFAGTNVGSNSAMMPLQAALGRAAGLGPLVLPALQNGTLALVISPQLTAVASGLAGGGVTASAVWRLTWPIVLISLLVGTVSIMVG